MTTSIFIGSKVLSLQLILTGSVVQWLTMFSIILSATGIESSLVANGAVAVPARIGGRSASGGAVTSGPSSEFCITETFHAHCPQLDHVIVMTSALYGRMRIGRCVRTDFGFVGCQADVLHIADIRCSGRRRCSILVPDPLFERTKAEGSCNEDLKSYFEASYVCVKVSGLKTQRCGVGGGQTESHVIRLRVTNPEDNGYISNTATAHEDLKSSTIPLQCLQGDTVESVPWLIEASSGTQIKLTLYDFSSGIPAPAPAMRISGSSAAGVVTNVAETTSVAASRSCTGPLVYGVVSEAGTTHKICGRRQSVSDVYLSVTNSVIIRLTGQSAQMTRNDDEDDNGIKSYLLLRYQVSGCSDPQFGPNVWLKRSGSTAILGCSSDGVDGRWKIECVDGKWRGSSTNSAVSSVNCSSLGAIMAVMSEGNGGSNSIVGNHGLHTLPFDLSVAIIAGLAFIVAVTVFTVGIVLIKRRRLNRNPSRDPNLTADSRCRITSGDMLQRLTTQTSKYPPPPALHEIMHDGTSGPRRMSRSSFCPRTGESDYAYVWDDPPPTPPHTVCGTSGGCGTDFRESGAIASDLGGDDSSCHPRVLDTGMFDVPRNSLFSGYHYEQQQNVQQHVQQHRQLQQ